jgi:hypothetical protein
MWLLLAPGEDWTWTIVGGYDSQGDCERAKQERMDGPLLCTGIAYRVAESPGSAPQATGSLDAEAANGR